MTVDIQNVPFIQFDSFRTSHNADAAAAVEPATSEMKFSRSNFSFNVIIVQCYLRGLSVIGFPPVKFFNGFSLIFEVRYSMMSLTLI